jgi:hypothetical protein
MPRAVSAWLRRSWLPLLLEEGAAVNPIRNVLHVIGLLPNLTVIQFGIACIVVGVLFATGCACWSSTGRILTTQRGFSRNGTRPR